MKKILIADDDTFLNTLYRVKFGQKGYDVQIATDGHKALELLHTFTPDIILLDLMMPGMDGFVALTEIRNQDRFNHIPIVVASNLGQQEDMDRAVSLGANDYVSKNDMPIQAIIDKIDTVLEQTRQAGF